MAIELLIHGTGVFALLLNIVALCRRCEKKLRIQSGIAGVAWALNNLLLGANTAAALSLVSAGRTATSAAMLFEDDQIFSGFSYYDFYPYIQQEPDPGKRAELMHELWMQDIAQWTPTLDTKRNISYWMPWARDFNGSHCLTIIDFSGTGMLDQGYADITPFVNANLNRGAVMRRMADNQIPGPIDGWLALLEIVMELFGL